MIRDIKCFIGFILLVSAIGAPVFLASGSAQAGFEIIFFDRDHRDHHRWDDREDRAYRRYYEENYHNRPFRPFQRLGHKIQRHYWNWRHQHHDDD